MKDNELDLLLAEYRQVKPTDLQTAKWKSAVRAELRPKVQAKPRGASPWLQLVAASVVGFIVGGLVFGFGRAGSGTDEENYRNVASNETFEMVYVKTD